MSQRNEFQLRRSMEEQRNLLGKWIELKQRGGSLCDFLEKNDIKKIALYGCNYISELLYNELQEMDIEIICGIDRNMRRTTIPYDVYNLEEFQKKEIKVDAVIVCVLYYFSEIYDELSQRFSNSFEILSVEDLVYDGFDQL